MTGLWRGAAPLLLASKSAARHSLLAAAGIPFESRDAAIDERGLEAAQAGCGGAEIARALARKKALVVAATEPGRLTLGADQTLAFRGRLFAKPRDRAGTAAQLAALSGGTHELYSALCLARDGRVLFEAVLAARLTVRALSAAFIEAYLDAAGDAVQGCVGAYQVEALGVHLFERIEGDHSVILGLPLLPLLTFLRAEGSLAG
jgi:septum formation protein